MGHTLAVSQPGLGLVGAEFLILTEPYEMIQARSIASAYFKKVPPRPARVKLWASIINNKQKTQLKICGITRLEDLCAASTCGVEWIGFNFYPGSKRYISPGDAAALLAAARPHCKPLGVVAVFVDPDDAAIDSALSAIPELAAVQWHGLGTPSRLAHWRSRLDKTQQLWRAIAVASPSDIIDAIAYENTCDLILFDSAKIAAGHRVAGGSGMRFPWDWLSSYQSPTPYGIAGGINPENIASAARQMAASQRPRLIDTATGAENHTPGVKDPTKIAALVAALREAQR